MPRLSVICATWNWSNALRCAIRSAVAQTFGDFEMLVIGDACTDDSGDVVASLDDPRLRWTNLPERIGSQWGPNNEGLRQATGEYIAYLGHDDVWHPTHLESLVRTLDASGADLAYAVAVLYGAPGTHAHGVTGLVHPAPGDPHAPFVGPSSLAHRRDLVDHIGPWRDARTQRLQVDDEFLQRAWQWRKRFAATEQLTVFRFPAAWRRNVYRRRPSDEQEACLEAMRAPDFQERQLLEVARAFALGSGVLVDPPRNWAPGDLHRHNFRTKGAGELEEAPPASSLKLAVDGDLDEPSGLFPAEVGEHGSYRWTGPGTVSSLRLPLAPGPDRTIAIRVDVTMVPVGEVRVRAGTVDLPVTVEGDGPWLLTGTLPAAAVRGDGVMLEIETPYTQRPRDVWPVEDARRLGVAIGAIIVGPIDRSQT